MTFPTFEEFKERWQNIALSDIGYKHLYDYFANTHQEELSIQRSVNEGQNKLLINCNKERRELKDRIEKVIPHNNKLIKDNSTLIKLLDKVIETIEPYDDLSELRNGLIVEKEKILEGKGDEK
jgi:uncharacterized protein YeeX (DUF496 family)